MGRQYYNKPKYDLMKDYIIFVMKLEKGQTFEKKWFVDAFSQKYPEFRESGIVRSLCRLSVNDPNRHIYSPSERDDFLWKVDTRTFRLYDKDTDLISNILTKNTQIPIKKNTSDENNQKSQKKSIEIIPKGIETIPSKTILINNQEEQPYKTENLKINDNDLISSESFIIAGNSEKEFDLINKAYQFNSKDKKPLFEEVPETRELWRNIRTPCRSDGDFCKFINSLYMLFFETTKNRDPYGVLDKNGYPIHIKRLPEKFIKQGTFTYHFMDIVGILRHVKGFAHIPSKLKLPPWKTSYEDAIQELLGNEPTVDEDYNLLQIELLKKLEKVMIFLHKIVKNKL